jgi:hypothetical protein
MRYLHYKSKADAARRLAEAFAEEEPASLALAVSTVHWMQAGHPASALLN